MAKYPEQTSKVLNPSGNVKMKDQMAHAAAPHTQFQEGGAPGTRSLADTTHGGMKNGGFVKAEVGNPGAPGMKSTGGNPVTAAEGSARPGGFRPSPPQRSAGAPRNVGNIADPKEPDADDGKKRKFGGFSKK